MHKAAKKQKLCWNCEGGVDRDSSNCLYCGVYLHPEEDEEELDSPYIPLYSPEAPEGEAGDSPTPLLYDEVEASEESFSSWQSSFLSLLFLSSGVLLFFFGLLLALFSKEGYLTLRWSDSYWQLYLALSAPLAYFGWRCLQQLP